MAIEITVPALGESVTEATVGQWFKKPGEAVNADEPLLELETDKVTLEVPAPAAGILAEIKVPEGSSVAVGSIKPIEIFDIIDLAVLGIHPATRPLPHRASSANPMTPERPRPLAA